MFFKLFSHPIPRSLVGGAFIPPLPPYPIIFYTVPEYGANFTRFPTGIIILGHLNEYIIK